MYKNNFIIITNLTLSQFDTITRRKRNNTIIYISEYKNIYN